MGCAPTPPDRRMGESPVFGLAAAYDEAERLRVERDRYREALERIAQRSPFGTSSEAAVIALAREALDG